MKQVNKRIQPQKRRIERIYHVPQDDEHNAHTLSHIHALHPTAAHAMQSFF